MSAAATFLQIAGLVIMGYGVWRTWEDFGPPGRMWDPPLAAIRAGWRRLTARLAGWGRRLLRRPPRKVVLAGAAVGAGSSVTARGRVQYPPVDASDPTAAITTLDVRVRVLVDRLADLQEHVEDEEAALRGAMQELVARLEREVSDLRAQDQRVAIGGIYWETIGLFVAGAGLVLQALAA